MRNNICTWVGFDVRVQAQVCLLFLPLCEGHTIRDRQVSMIKVLLLRHLKNGSRLQFWWVRATYAQSPHWFQTWTPQVWRRCNLSHFNTHLIWIPSVVLGSLGICFALAPVGFHGFRSIFLIPLEPCVTMGPIGWLASFLLRGLDMSCQMKWQSWKNFWILKNL